MFMFTIFELEHLREHYINVLEFSLLNLAILMQGSVSQKFDLGTRLHFMKN